MAVLEVDDHVTRILNGARAPGPRHDTQGLMASSWQRCLDAHRFNPGDRRHIDVISEAELRRQRQAIDEVLHYAEAEMTGVFSAVSAGGFSISISDTAGRILTERSDYHDDYYSEVERCGTLWTEEAAGTNGIGTCLVERKPLLVFKNDHFFHSFAELSCAVAPLYGADARMLGVVNLSIRSPELERQTLRVAHGLTLYTVNRLDERLFRHAFRRNHILRFAAPDKAVGLIAIDQHFHVSGMNHAARLHLLGDGEAATPSGLWHLFERDHRLMAPGRSDGATVSLRPLGASQAMVLTISDPVENPARRARGTPVAPAGAKLPVAALDLEACAGGDPLMLRNIRYARRTVAGNLPLLVLGETGVGKDAFARAVHADSARHAGPFVAFNCAAVPETLIDSELFGYGGGAFTGARKEGYGGRVVEADGGTLFLDEIGDMPLMLQTRLLHILESGEVTPLGSGRSRPVDLQVIAATNQNLEERIDAGQFRRDLYYRLAGTVVHLPPLRDRDDIAEVIRLVLGRVPGSAGVALSVDAQEALLAHGWPGNIRELRHTLHRAVQLCDGGIIAAEDLMLPISGVTGRPAVVATQRRPAAIAGDRATSARAATAAAERDIIAEAMSRCAGNVKQAADELSLSRATLYRKLRRYDLLG